MTSLVMSSVDGRFGDSDSNVALPKLLSFDSDQSEQKVLQLYICNTSPNLLSQIEKHQKTLRKLGLRFGENASGLHPSHELLGNFC